MPAIITDKFRIHNSEQFFESFSEASPNVYYLGIGRPQDWTTSTRPDNRTENEGTDSASVVPSESVVEEFYSFDDLLAVKKISSSDVSKVIPRRNWTTGTVYDYYRHDYGKRITGTTTIQTSNSGATSLADATFYVKTSDQRIYKCLWNNNGAISTEEPTTTSPSSTQTTSDGYIWKYMYTLTSTQIQNFLSTDFMSVETDSSVLSAAIDGAIDIVTIKETGTGGTDGTHTNIPIRGDGSNGQVSVTITTGSVSNVTVTASGSNYTFGYITLSDINSAGGGALINAQLDVIIPPKGGHGFNAIKELGGYYVMLNQVLEGTETSNSGDFTVENNFRRIVLIRDPNSGGSAASAITLRSTKALIFSSSPTPGTFQIDEKISQATTGAVGKVVEWDSVNRILYYTQTRFSNEGVDSHGDLVEFSGANVVSGATSLATGTPDASISTTVNNVSFTSGYSTPELDHDSGDIMYIENRAPIARASDQTENVKLVIEF